MQKQLKFGIKCYQHAIFIINKSWIMFLKICDITYYSYGKPLLSLKEKVPEIPSKMNLLCFTEKLYSKEITWMRVNNDRISFWGEAIIGWR